LTFSLAAPPWAALTATGSSDLGFTRNRPDPQQQQKESEDDGGDQK
jgi:hypothetical protein